MLLSYNMLRKSQIEISELRFKTGYTVVSSEWKWMESIGCAYILMLHWGPQYVQYYVK